MAYGDLNELTVVELRKLAKELKVTLGAGATKASIIDMLNTAIAQQSPTEEESPAAPLKATLSEDSADDAQSELPKADAPAQPTFRQAYVAPPRFNSKPSYQALTSSRSSAPKPAPMEVVPRPQPVRATGFAPRFGPTASVAEPLRDEPQRVAQPVERKPLADASPLQPLSVPGDTLRFDAPAETLRPAYEPPKPVFEAPKPTYEAPVFETPKPAADRPAYSNRREAPSSEAAPVYSNNPSVTELIAPADFPECTGMLDLMPEGYGFLRGDTLLSTGRDVYVSAAQIRRFALRSGDRITGKCRPQRDGDKYAALLTVASVNNESPDASVNRPNFESLTAIYPNRRISLENRIRSTVYSDMRLMDLITPIGFGQRALLQCAPRTNKTRLLQHLANAIIENHPEAIVMTLLFNENPEDVTLFREQVNCPVYASTFDMLPENHLKLSDMVLDQAQRLVEAKHDVVLLVDSLTALTKVATTAAMQAGRVVPGMINPTSLQKAKRLFGAARCLREGGSLTVIATMTIDSGAKAEDTVVNDFRGAANMELVLDQALARAGLYPPMVLAQSGTRRAEALLTPAHQEGLKLIRSMLGRLTAEQALTEVKAMLEKASTNEDLLARVKEWAQAMQN